MTSLEKVVQVRGHPLILIHFLDVEKVGVILFSILTTSLKMTPSVLEILVITKEVRHVMVFFFCLIY